MNPLAPALVLFLLGATPAAGDRPAVLRDFDRLQEKRAAAWAAYSRKGSKARDIESLQALVKENPDLRFTPRILALAEKYAADPAAVVPALATLGCTAPDELKKPSERALAVILRHADSKYLIPAVPTLVHKDAVTATILTAVIAKHPDRKTQARACRLRLRDLSERIEKGTRADQDDDYRGLLERQTTPQYVRDLLARLPADRKEYLRLSRLLDGPLARLLPDLAPGHDLPDVAFTDVAGKKHRLRDFRGKILLVHVFDTTRHQPKWIYYAQQYYWADEHRGRPVVRVHVCVDARKETYDAWLRNHPLDGINVWAGPPSDFFADWLADERTQMQTYLVSPRGTIVMRSPATNDMHGPMDWEIREMLADLKVPAPGLPPAAPKVKGDGLSEAAKAYEQLRLDFRYGARRWERAFMLARDDDDKRRTSAEHSWATYAERAMELAEKYIDDPASFDLLAFRIRLNANTSEESYVHALHLLGKHHAANPRMIELLQHTHFGRVSYAVFLSKVLEKNPDRKIQARACRMLRDFYEGRVGSAEQYLQADGQLRAAIRRRSGDAHVQELLNALANNKELRARYKKLFDEKYAHVLTEFKDGRPMPDAELTAMDGKKFKLSDLRGKVVYLNIFSAEDHRLMFDHQRALADRLKGKPFVLINLSVDERKEDFVWWLKRDPSPWVNAWCGRRSEFYTDWMNGTHPTSYLIDGKGVLRSRQASWGDLPDRAEELLAEMDGAARRPSP
jgi:peroxiredoxin